MAPSPHVPEHVSARAPGGPVEKPLKGHLPGGFSTGPHGAGIRSRRQVHPHKSTGSPDWKIDETHVASLAASARARWKIENENNNTLKTKGYHLEHNFGHGKKHLAAVLTSLNLLAFLVHTALGWVDESYRALRARLSSRRTFFEHVRALTFYIHFPDWSGLMDFMMRGLELGPYAKKS